MSGDPSFDLFQLPDEHASLRTAIRALSEKEIAPYAADVDENARFPAGGARGAQSRRASTAVHVPEEYGGQGADAVATCIVIEEVARVCASASLIPAVNKLGTMGLILSRLRGAEEAGAAVDRRRARRWRPTRCRSARPAAMRRRCATRAKRRRRRLDPQRHQVLDHQRRQVDLVHGDGGDRPGQGRQRHLGVHGAQGRRGIHRRAQGTQARHQGLTDHRAVLRELPDPRRPDHRRARHRLQDRAGDARPHPARRSARRRSASPRARWTRRSHTPRTASSSASRSSTSRACSSCSPTWR